MGDIARSPHALFDAEAMRIEHWQFAGDTARHAARTVLFDLGVLEAPPGGVDMLPSFWSDQGDVHLNSFGVPGLGSRAVVLERDLDSEAVVGYFRGEQPVGVVLVGQKRRMTHYRRWLRERLQPADDAAVQLL